MGKKLYNVNGAKFEVDERYSIIKPIGYGAYGFVWYVKAGSEPQDSSSSILIVNTQRNDKCS